MSTHVEELLITLRSSAQGAVSTMSSELRSELTRQLTTTVGQYGKNIRVTVPSGMLANEMRLLSINLILSGAVLRGNRYVGTLQREDKDVSMVFHHELVEELLKRSDAYTAIRAEAASRLRRLKELLHQRLCSSLDPETTRHATMMVHFNDAASVVDVGAAVYQLFGNHAEPVDTQLHPEVLGIIRHIIAPYYEQHADVDVVFDSENPWRTAVSLNHLVVGS